MDAVKFVTLVFLFFIAPFRLLCRNAKISSPYTMSVFISDSIKPNLYVKRNITIYVVKYNFFFTFHIIAILNQ